MDAYTDQLASLTGVQRQAVDWNEGPLLVLAGPGSGKTRVLTCRIARILHDSPDRTYRVLALTFTNKAADEMLTRVQLIASGAEARASICTFHSFCMQMLQQHGTHLGIDPDFLIYSHDEDRRELLRDGLRRAALNNPSTDASLVRYLQLIDKLKGRLIGPADAAAKFSDPQEGRNVSTAYSAYEEELRRANAMDFNSLIQRAHELVTKFDGIAARYRKSYRYWMLDEFQDTNRAQYRFLKALAGPDFNNIFAVADDDQIIYQWNGASFQQLQQFRQDFEPELIQLPTNYRCPAPIVASANNLVSHNSKRTQSKVPLQSGKTQQAVPDEDCILMGSYSNETDEATAIAEMISVAPRSTWGETAVIARTRALVEGVKSAMQSKGVPAAIAQRRDEFVSAQYSWLLATLRQASRPLDRRNFDSMISAFNRWTGSACAADMIASQASGSSRSLLDEWAHSLESTTDARVKTLAELVLRLARELSYYRSFLDQVLAMLVQEEGQSPSADLAEDGAAWKDLSRTIINQLGKGASLEQFLQHMALQSKEPPPAPNTVTLMTIHAAKGKEFDYVYVAGLAESVLPSYQSVQAGPLSDEMEEERRNCFVAITRAKEQLILTWARSYRGYAKKPSRFLTEMGFAIP